MNCKEGVHTERACFVGDDRHDPLADAFIIKKFAQQANEGLGSSHFLVTRATLNDLIGVFGRQGDFSSRGRLARGHVTAECSTSFLQVLRVLVFGAGVEIRRELGVQRTVGDVEFKAIAESLEVINGQLLHLVRGIAAFEVRTQRPTLDGVSQDHRRLPLVLNGCAVSGIHLLVVVATALKLIQLLVGEVFDQLGRTRIATKEVFAHECATFGLVGLEVAVGCAVHDVDQRTGRISGKQGIPTASPNHLNDIPASATEERFEFLNDLAVTAHWSIKSLQVCTDDKREVVEFLTRCQTNGTQGFGLIHFAVAEEGPHVLP